ncbi:MAG: quinone-dependent dihydroorotate dehydrogenase, partial [Candidatus Regiella insecticola]|nr:quinone-dependent dihydroorotate dehydrogenase [Candidatus Regiella insecticola]
LSCIGLSFKNPLGLAAGLDKDGEYINILAAMGFGFIEIGTVTPRPQTGNDKPRLFRVAKAEALINRMGFNNKGVDNLINNVKKARFDGIL